jgi:hypothetical protein
MCVGLPKTAELLFLAALFFVSFFWASKRKKRYLRFYRKIFNLPYFLVQPFLLMNISSF